MSRVSGRRQFYNSRVRNLLRILWVGLVLLVVALLSALAAMHFAIHEREVTVPDMLSKTPVEARRIAQANGLAAQVEREYYSPAVPAGKVVSQMPPPGAVVRRGWEVRLALSLGPQRVAIPQVVGESDRAAAITLNQRGLDVASTANMIFPGAAAGEVIAQDPPANATGIAAPKISLLVAAEAQPQAFVMPSFVGQPLGSVTATLQDAGFSVGKVTLQPEASAADPQAASSPPAISPASLVVSHDPAPGQKVLQGT